MTTDQPEKALLGSWLISPEKVLNLCRAKNVTGEWFAHPVHAELFQALLEMDQEKRPVELVSLTQFVEARERLEACGGAPFITELFTIVPTGENAPYYLTLLQEAYAQRLAVKACEDTKEKVLASRSLQDIYDAVSGPFVQVQEACAQEDDKDYDQKAMMSYFDHMEAMASGKSAPEFFRTGIPTIDESIGGFMRGQLVMIRGRSGTGKSLAAQKVICSNAFSEKQANIALFTYEMPYAEYMNRLVADIGTIDLQNMFHGRYNKREMDSFQRSMTTIMESKLRIYDTDRVKKRTPQAFFSWTRKHAKNYGLDMVVLDHQHLLDMGGGKKSEKRTDEAMHDFSAEFKAMCLELKVVGLLLAQENTDGGTFGSTQVQTDVDHCFSLTPVWKLINNIKRIVGTDGMYCDKCRTGPLLGRKIPLKMTGQYARLEEAPKEVVSADVF